MKLETILIGVLILSLMMVGQGQFYSSVLNRYDVNGTDLSTFNYEEEINETTGGMGKSIKTGETIYGGNLPVIDQLLSYVKSLADLPSTLGSAWTEVHTAMGLPDWVYNIPSVILVTIIVSIIAGIFLGRSGGV